VQQQSQALPTAKLDRVEHVAHGWNLLCHVAAYSTLAHWSATDTAKPTIDRR
jgi:hypothetical protein